MGVDIDVFVRNAAGEWRKPPDDLANSYNPWSWFDDRNYVLFSALGHDRSGLGMDLVGQVITPPPPIPTGFAPDEDDFVYGATAEELFDYDWHQPVTYERGIHLSEDPEWQAKRATVLGEPWGITCFAYSTKPYHDIRWTAPYSTIIGRRWFERLAALDRGDAVYWVFS